MLPSNIQNFLLSRLKKISPYKSGYRAICPFHYEDTPSFFVFKSDRDSGWYYKCFGCDTHASGTLYNLLKRLDGPFYTIPQPKVIHGHRADKQAEIEAFTPDITDSFYTNFDYYVSRGISIEVATRFRFKVVFGEYPAAVMPVYTRYKYVGYVKRFTDPNTKQRYQLQPGCDFSKALWAFDEINPQLPTIVTEGIIDAACWWTQGVQAVALVTGKKWESKLNLLQTLKTPIYTPDNGDINSLTSFRSLHLAHHGRYLFIPRRFKDTSEFVTSGGDLKTLLQLIF